MKKKLFIFVLVAAVVGIVAGCSSGMSVQINTPVPNAKAGTPAPNGQINVPGVNIQVYAPGPNPMFNTPDGHGAPANIWLCSVTRHFPDRVASVQYFAGTTGLGIATNWPSFCFRWTNVPPGAYALTATAREVAGTNTVTSPPVDIMVKTNRPPSRRW